MPKITIDSSLLCPITEELMSNPVDDSDGNTYEWFAIEKWFSTHDTSPITKLKLANKQLTVNQSVKEAIQNFKNKHQLCTFEEFIEAIITDDLPKVKNMNYTKSHINSASITFPPLPYAAMIGKVKIIQFLLSEGANLEAQVFDGRTSLHIAAQMGHDDVVEYLLSQNANVMAQDSFNRTPLHIAAWYDHVKAAEILLEHGANPNTVDSRGDTPLHNATQKTKSETIVKLLITKNVNLDACNAEGFTALHYAAQRGYSNFIKLLIDAGADLESHNNSWRWTALYVAIYNISYYKNHNLDSKDIEASIKLLIDYGADIRALDRKEKTPQQVAEALCLDDLAEKISRWRQQAELTSFRAYRRTLDLEKKIKEKDKIILKLQKQLEELTSNKPSENPKAPFYFFSVPKEDTPNTDKNENISNDNSL